MATLSSEFCIIEIVVNVNGKRKKLFLFVTFLKIHLCSTLRLEPESSEPEPHRVTAPAPPK
jgi:hypothetical protein